MIKKVNEIEKGPKSFNRLMEKSGTGRGREVDNVSKDRNSNHYICNNIMNSDDAMHIVK